MIKRLHNTDKLLILLITTDCNTQAISEFGMQRLMKKPMHYLSIMDFFGRMRWLKLLVSKKIVLKPY
jgi:hypothetical protein